MLELKKTNMVLTSFNPRAELHGDDPKPAADLTLEAKLPNSVLAEFDPTLKALLYVKDTEQADLVSEGDPEHMTKRRFPKMSPFKWDDEIVGAQVTIHWGVGKKSDVVLGGCVVGNYKIDAEEGGTVKLTLRVQCHPSESQAGKVCMLVGSKIDVTIEPPEADEELVEKAPKGRKSKTAGNPADDWPFPPEARA